MNQERKRKTQRHRYTALLVLISILGLCLTGCVNKDGNGVKVVLTTGFARDEVFRINRDSCKKAEVMVYLTNMQNQYESVLGKEIWKKDLGGSLLQDSLKENVLARIAQIKAMNLLAQRQSMELAEKEVSQAKAAAAQYYQSLNETEIGAMGVTEDIILKMYQEYALANKVYYNIIKDINPEISDDEARTITVQQVYIKTYTLDGGGERIPFGQKEKGSALEKARAVERLAKEGTSFEQLIGEYSDDQAGTYSFGKGEMDAAFEKAAFDLGNDEISGVVESQHGYHVIKCISTFDRAETDANKVKIVEQRKKEVFNQEYDEFLSTLTKNLNEKLWESITFIEDENVQTKDFFQVYYEHFSDVVQG